MRFVENFDLKVLFLSKFSIFFNFQNLPKLARFKNFRLPKLLCAAIRPSSANSAASILLGISAAAKANCNALRKFAGSRILRVPKIGVAPTFRILSRFLPPREFEKALWGDVQNARPLRFYTSILAYLLRFLRFPPPFFCKTAKTCFFGKIFGVSKPISASGFCIRPLVGNYFARGFARMSNSIFSGIFAASFVE